MMRKHVLLPLAAALAAKLAPHRVPKFVASSGGCTAVAYWGGTLQVFAADGTLTTQQLQPQDISSLAWAGNTLILGQSDGCVLALQTTGNQRAYWKSP
jgi:hypothetical protein